MLWKRRKVCNPPQDIHPLAIAFSQKSCIFFSILRGEVHIQWWVTERFLMYSNELFSTFTDSSWLWMSKCLKSILKFIAFKSLMSQGECYHFRHIRNKSCRLEPWTLFRDFSACIPNRISWYAYVTDTEFTYHQIIRNNGGKQKARYFTESKVQYRFATK